MKKILTTAASLLFIFAIMSCGGKKEADKTEYKQALLNKAKNVFAVMPDKMPGSENDTPDRIVLGKKLYFDGRLSENDQISCNSCHIIGDNKGGVDNLPTSPGTKGENGTRNSPTVLNAGFQFVQFWDGREPDLKAQAKGPILNPVEMAMPSEEAVVKKISAIAEYKDMFAKAFPEGKGVTYDNIAEAIAAFERTLITKDRFDDFLNGDLTALSNSEAEGLDLFMNKGCITCHTGSLLGGNMYQKTGLVKPYANQVDQGRFEVTKNEADKMMFKVPTMRNIAITGPYFHDGSEPSLRNTIKIMGDIQLGQQITNLEAMKIEKFLNSLTGKNLNF
jgi:cytochrome c peroxidase